MKAESSHRVARIGMLAGLTIALQLAPSILPGVGLALSAFSTLPIYVLTRFSAGEGLIGLVASAAVLAGIQPGAALLLVLLTGPVGLALGWAGHARWRLHWRILLATAAETAGMMSLGAIIGVPAFSRVFHQRSQWVTIAVVTAFSLIYSLLWATVLEDFVMPLLRRTPFWRGSGT